MNTGRTKAPLINFIEVRAKKGLTSADLFTIL